MYSKYLSDSHTEAALSDQMFIKKFLQYEIALAQVQSKEALISYEAADEIKEVLERISIDPKTLADSFLANGIPSIEILRQCREQLSEGAKKQVHFGITSQDVIDTAHIMMYRDVMLEIHQKIQVLLELASDSSERYKDTLAMARTRTQQAGPITYGLRMALWMKPILFLYQQFDALAADCFKLQLAGAFGTNVDLIGKAKVVAEKLADLLDLSYHGNWHSNRLSIKMLSDWLCGLSGSLGKIAQDILFLSSTEVGEMKEDKHGGGQSTAMPHKSNPILSESILALAKENNIEALKINQAQLHAGERDATSWILEWKAMKTLLINTATSLNHMTFILENFELNEKNMARNLGMVLGMNRNPGDAYEIIDTFIKHVKTAIPYV